MKIIGIVFLVCGLVVGAFALAMNVGVDVPPTSIAGEFKAPAMQVANVELMARKQNFLTVSSTLSIVGAILIGFATLAPATQPVTDFNVTPAAIQAASTIPELKPTQTTSVSICPKCRHMGSGDATACARCGAELDA